MANDPYTVLGVARDATDKQIRSAFLKLAKTSHPDLHPGDAHAEERFKAANAANDLLSDPDRRARFDRGEIDGSGQERPQPSRSYSPGRGLGLLSASLDAGRARVRSARNAVGRFFDGGSALEGRGLA